MLIVNTIALGAIYIQAGFNLVEAGDRWNHDWSTNPPLRNRRPYSRLINHWFPLIRPGIKPFFVRGGRLGAGVVD